MGVEEALSFEERVELAFANVPYPGDDDIAYDNTGYDLDCEEVLATFRSRSWKSISKAEVFQHRDSFPVFTPVAFHYYLPAFLVACSKYRLELDVAPEHLAFNLTPPKQETGSSWDFFWARARLFDPGQGGVILEYLELCADFVRNDWAGTGKAPPSLARLEHAIAWWKTRLGGA